jgi:cell division inhibitor SepF
MFSKLRDFLGFNESEEYEEYYEEEETDSGDYQSLYPVEEPPQPIVAAEEPAPRRRPRETTSLTPEIGMTTSSSPRSNVIGMPGVSTSVAEVVVYEPRSFEEMPQVIQALRDRRSVVLNLNMMDPDEAQRAVDFVAGGTYAIDGHQERIGDSIFLFTPNCVQVTTQSGMVHEAVGPVKSVSPRTNVPTPAWSAPQVAAQ